MQTEDVYNKNQQGHWTIFLFEKYLVCDANRTFKKSIGIKRRELLIRTKQTSINLLAM